MDVKARLWWLRGISVRKGDGFALDCFIFLELWLSQMKGCKSISCICMEDADAIRYSVRRWKGERFFQALQQHADTWNAISPGIAA